VSSASLDNDVRKLPNFNYKNNDSAAAFLKKIDDFFAALEKMKDARASATSLLASSPVTQVRLRIPDVNTSAKTMDPLKEPLKVPKMLARPGGDKDYFATDITVGGIITIQ
jgi:hypothetical protein